MIKYKDNINELKIKVETLKTENERQNLKTLQDEQRPECTIRDDRCGKTKLCLSPFLFSILLEVFTSVLMKGKKIFLIRKEKKRFKCHYLHMA